MEDFQQQERQEVHLVKFNIYYIHKGGSNLKMKRVEKKGKGYLKSFKKTFMDSFKLDKNFMFAVLYDSIFYGLLVVIISVFMLKILEPNIPILSQANQVFMKLQADPTSADYNQVANLKAAVDSLKMGVIMCSLLAFGFFLVLKAFVWKKVAGMKLDWNYVKNFAIVNLVIYFALFIILLLSIAIFKEGALVFFGLLWVLLALHFSYVMASLLTKHNLKKSAKNLWKIAAGNIHYYLPAYLIMDTVFVLLLFVDNMIFPTLLGIPLDLRRLIVVLIVVVKIVYLTWVKNYVHKITLDRIKNA